MHLRSTLLLVLLGVLFIVPTALATVTITAAKPAAPIAWDQPTKIDVTIVTSCATVAQDNRMNNIMALQLTASSDAPWLSGKGDSVPYTTDNCDSNTASQGTSCTPQPACASNYPTATFKGKVTLTPRNDAPALRPAKVTIAATGVQGQTVVNISVAYHGSLNASGSPAVAKAGLNQTVPLNLSLEVFTNGKSMIMFTVAQDPRSGQLQGLPSMTDVQPATSYFMSMAGMGDMWMDGGPEAGKTKTLLVPLGYHSSAKAWTGDNVTIQAQLMSYDDAKLVSAPVSVHWAAEPIPGSQSKKGTSPAPEVGVVVLALLGLILARRLRA
jgi:hypothetical protein